MGHNIVLDKFQGPLDLLIDLIEKAKVDIYDIPINMITEQYMEYIYSMDRLDLDIASDFLVMASSLLHIKSRMLLPKDKVILDGEEVEIDPREELVLQILAYKKFKEVSEQLREVGIVEAMAYYKPQEDLSIYEEEEVEIGPFDLNLLMEAINNIIGNREIAEVDLDLREIRRDEFSIKECTDNIIEILEEKGRILFTDLLNRDTSLGEIIAYFLSLLELAKSGYLSLKQNKSYSNINIIKISSKEQII